MTDQSPTPTTSKLSKRWIRKMVIFWVVLLGFGLYGLYDAMVAYPARGERDASYRLWKYLDASFQAHGLSLPMGVEDGQDPAKVYNELDAKLDELYASAGGASVRAKDDAAKIAKHDWFRALKVLGKLDADRINTDVALDSAKQRYDELQTLWKSKDQPKPLAGYDIPVQWIFVVVGLGGCLWLTIHILNTARKKYTFDPETLTLTIPGGHSITPGDVDVFDRRKWDKFILFLKINAEHKALGGQEIKLDLYQYEPLEQWAVAMHKHAHPEDFEPEEENDQDSESPSQEQQDESHPS